MLLPLALLAAASPLMAQFQVRIRQADEVATLANAGIYTTNGVIGQTTALQVQITYRGSQAVSLDTLSTAGAPQFVTADVPAIPSQLRSNQSITFNVFFRPTSGNRVSADITLAYADISLIDFGRVATGTLSFTLVGTAPSQSLNASLPPDNNFFGVSEGGRIQFPQVLVNSSTSATIVLRNRGSGAGTVNSVSLAGADFQLQGVPILPARIESNEELRFAVRFLPRQREPSTGSLRVAFDNAVINAVLEGSALDSLLSYSLIVGQQTTPLAANGTIALPAVGIGESGTAQIRVQNASRLDAPVNSISVSGAGFTLVDSPTLPLTMPPGASFTFGFAYAPQQLGRVAGRLRVNLDAFDLVTEGQAPRLQFTYRTGDSDVPLLPGGSLLFGSIEVGATARATIQISNTGSAAASIPAIVVTQGGEIFRIATLPPLPLNLDPNGTSQLTVEMRAQNPGTYNGVLTVGSFLFNLNGFVSAQPPPPPLPAYRFEGAGGNQQPRDQVAVGLTLAEAYRQTVTGTLNMIFNPETSGSDPALQFSTGGRQVRFTIAANTTQAVFENNSQQIRLQTGTVAGNIILTPSFATTTGTNLTPDLPTSLTLTVPSGPPQLVDAQLSSSARDSFVLTVTGYSTTRSLRTLNLRFTPSATATLAASEFQINLQSSANAWFSNTGSAAFGGLFVATVPFTLASSRTDDPANLVRALQSIAITAVSERGNSNTINVTPQ